MRSFNNYIVNLNNLKHNFNLIKSKLNENIKVCSMVKADAYGHGLKTICKSLNGTDFFGVANVQEAMQIRQFDKSTSILIVGTIDKKHCKWCSKNNVSIACTGLDDLKEIIKNVGSKNIKIHIKINTGLNRIGVNNLLEFTEMLSTIHKYKNIIFEGLFTHFATKSNDIDFIIFQHNQFLEYVKLINDKNVIVHCCNSYASLCFPSFHHNMVRCGFNLYGWQNLKGYDFRPVLNIESQIVSMHKVRRGESIGYDRTYVAPYDMTIAVVPVGYADGLDRRLSNNFSLIVNNCFAKIVGNICMDVCLIDVSNCNAKLYDKVILLGDSENLSLTPYSYAETLNTSPYEILLKFRYKRFNRILIK